MAIPEMQLAGMTPETIYENLQKAGVNATDAGVLVSSWIFHNFGGGQRSFDYAQAFDATDADCVATFARGFHHADWVDGESVVQAQQTTGEEGFNDRFHKIEADIDALGAEVAKVFTCLAEVRQALHDRLGEIKAELNRIDADIYNLQAGGGIGFPRPLPLEAPRFQGLAQSGNFLGATTLGGNPVTMWNTSQGVMVLPAFNTQGIDPSNNDRVRAAAGLAQFVTENADVAKMFTGQPVTKEQFIARFGNQVTSSGVTVGSVASILPAGASFTNANDLVTAVSNQQAAALRTTTGVAPVFANALGVSTGATAGAASITKVGTIPSDAQAALSKAGIDTVDKLASADPKTVTDALAKGGVTSVTSGQAAGWIAAGKTIRGALQ